MEMTASSAGGNLSNINSYSDNANFYTKSEPNSWVKADLKGYKLKPKSYILRSSYGFSCSLLRRWMLEGIKEDGTSIVLDNQYYEFQLNEIKEFPLQTNDYFVAFKITQTGKDSKNRDYLSITVFDFKGELIKF
ncbi:Mig-related protein [Trichomonas vaginalis G3]|uniref:Mig-related protein n=1 Tax=Trichomonas vaginalis (strain ATCC PRA-98 / G3) TaxID=412133 RepID=A2F3Y7_TRIV3|nr:BTB and C-terminal Kelch family [Trichomonas vaginalis G3]EAY00403.1 Mig-related protein [Trichomonas vaginalis G3]KAI5528372.1 BTB and C-terminal Kelch family [Trichomonas vaginalis G3]|eukprot:XP_001313332.1 Mig-related protein [Trichomonas vaginalis G3]